MAKSRYQLAKTGPVASFFVVLSLALGGLLLTACGDPGPTAQTYSGAIMGTSYHVKVVASGEQVGLGERIHGVLDRVDQQMSTYKPESYLSRFNAAPVGEAMTVPAELMAVLQLSATVHQQTEGAFDPTVGPLVNLWGFGPDHHQDQVPPADQIAALLEAVGFDALVLNPQMSTITKTRPATVDLSAVAKGYAVDLVAELLRTEGFSDFMVEVGGEMALAGHNERGLPWQIAIEKPDAASRAVQQIVGVTDAGVATSGDYRNYFEKNGVRYSHTIDPRTGYPIEHALASVTVVAESSGLADALATAFMVMGTDKALAFAERNGIAIFTLSKTGEGFAEAHSSHFKTYLNEDN